MKHNAEIVREVVSEYVVQMFAEAVDGIIRDEAQWQEELEQLVLRALEQINNGEDQNNG